MAKQKSNSRKAFETVNYIFMFIVIAVTLIPCIYVLAVSLSDNHSIMSGEVFLIPKGITLDAYEVIWLSPKFWKGYSNTILYTVSGTLVSIFMTILCAYPLSKKDMPARRVFLGLIVFTMYFSGGLIPSYLLVTKLKLINTLWAVIIPGSISAFNMIIMRTFFEGIPVSLQEAAMIDGLNPFGVLLKIVLPLSKPIIATMSLFYALWYWNDWFSALLYLNDVDKYPVTMILRNVVMGAQMAMMDPTKVDPNSIQVVAESIQAATIVMVMLPILFVYPFVQKYFVKGVMIGSVKG